MLYKSVQSLFPKGCLTGFSRDEKRKRGKTQVIQMRTDPDFISLQEKIARNGKKKADNVWLETKGSFFAWKRVFDIAFSSFVIIFILSWLTPIIALLIWIDSGRPIFFLQKRVGRGGVPFTCFKFRSMVVNAEADRVQAVPHDIRITFIGKFLRRTNIDELPQFVNVFLGHMSIIGPRPHMYVDHYNFSALVKEYEFRTLVRPGITGLAQVKGFSGPAFDMESIFGRYQWDAFYVRNASVVLDIRILRNTISKELISWFKVIR